MVLEETSLLTADGLDTILGVLLAGVGLYLAHSIRRQLRLRVAEQRLEAYRGLWSETGLASPTVATAWRKKAVCDREGWHDPRNPPLPRIRRERLAEHMTEWYYEEGNGMFLHGVTRDIFLTTKENLTCDVGEYKPKKLRCWLESLSDEHRELVRGYLSVKQLSLLRTQMKSDLAVYASARSRYELEPHEESFVVNVGGNPYGKPWSDYDIVPVGALGRLLSHAASRGRGWLYSRKLKHEESSTAASSDVDSLRQFVYRWIGRCPKNCRKDE